MELTKGTLLGAITLVVIVIGVLFVRNKLFEKREACGKRMLTVAALLVEYADTHHGKLPHTKDELDDTLGQYAGEFVGPVTAQLNLGTYHISRGKPVPYLWDVSAHPIIGKHHVLYTNGKVYLQPDLPKAQPQ